MAIIILSPVFSVVPLLIKLNSKGPVFYKQKRIGKDLKPFYLYKFRTMVVDAHARQSELQHVNEMTGGGLFKIDNDPRVTPLGKILRKFSIDEFPQLFNIIRGEMSVIGPRALSTPVNMYEPYQLKRFIMKPGLGCIWQAYFRRDTNFTKWIKTDLLYVRKVSLGLDIKLLFKIFINVITAKGA